MKRRLDLVCAVVVTSMLSGTACQNMPGSFAPPVQRQPLEEFRPYRMSSIVDMANEDSTTHFVQDLESSATPGSRWTGKRATVRVRMRSAENLRYTIDFAVPESSMKDRGPVTVSFLVNDQLLSRVRYPRAGDQHFEKTVPSGWVTAGQDVMVAAEVDKLWIPPGGEKNLGIVLARIGLTQ